MAQSPQRIPDQNIIRTVKDVVNANADLLIVSGAATDTGFALTTEGGDEIPIDLTEGFVTREEFTNSTDVPLASEEQSGRLQIVTGPEAIKAEDDSKAMTALKSLQLILSMGIPRFDIGDGEDGQSLLIEVVDGEIIIKPGAAVMTLPALLAGSSKAERNAFILGLLNSIDASDAAHARLCILNGLCSVRPTYNFTNGIDYEAIPAVITTPTTLDPSYIGRYDANNCDEFSGWFVDINNPNSATPVRIERDGVLRTNIIATRLRDDVRKALIQQGKLPAGATFNTYGWVYTKQASDKDGQPHTFKAFGGTSQTVATTDVGAPATVTCGAVVNPPTTNNPPQIVGVYNDQEVYAAGDQLLASIAGLFSDTDALTYSATMADGSPLMAGIVFTPTDAKPFKILASFPNQQQPIKLIATDTAGQSTPKLFLLTVARPVITDNPVTLVNRVFAGDTECIEGNGARVKIINNLSNGSTSDYTGGGTYRIVAPYPDQMTITTDANAVGIIATKETVVADVPVTLEFKFPDNTVITGPFTVRNKVVATSPITSYIINDLSIIEGSQGVSQVYAVHADGSFTEVTQANGSTFELVAPYPNGMSLAFGNTARATVSTAGNSVTANVEVKIRFTFGGGGVVEGKITVQNQNDNPTTPPVFASVDVVITPVSDRFQAFFYYDAPNGWQAKTDSSGRTSDENFFLLDKSGGASPTGFYSTSVISGCAVGDVITVQISPDGVNDIITRTVTITGAQARTNLYSSPTN